MDKLSLKLKIRHCIGLYKSFSQQQHISISTNNLWLALTPARGGWCLQSKGEGQGWSSLRQLNNFWLVAISCSGWAWLNSCCRISGMYLNILYPVILLHGTRLLLRESLMICMTIQWQQLILSLSRTVMVTLRRLMKNGKCSHTVCDYEELMTVVNYKYKHIQPIFYEQCLQVVSWKVLLQLTNLIEIANIKIFWIFIFKNI